MAVRIYAVTDRRAAGARFFEIIEALLAEGVCFIQLREKDISAAELYELGAKIMDMGKKKGLKLVVNDRVDVALALNAHGVQITEGSIVPEKVRKLSKKLKIGLSVHDTERLKRHNGFFDFAVFGNVFETDSKPGVIGKGVFALREAAGQTEKPVYAIGGMNSSNAELAVLAGAYGIALKGPFFSSPDPLEEIKKIKEVFRRL